jgi:hypothetical protein
MRPNALLLAALLAAAPVATLADINTFRIAPAPATVWNPCAGKNVTLGGEFTFNYSTQILPGLTDVSFNTDFTRLTGSGTDGTTYVNRDDTYYDHFRQHRPLPARFRVTGNLFMYSSNQDWFTVVGTWELEVNTAGQMTIVSQSYDGGTTCY